MKVIILAGGWGTRLGRLTDYIPKPMVKIGGKPILWHILKIYSYYGYTDFVICLGVKGEIIKDYFYNFELKNNNFTIDLSDKSIIFHNENKKENWRVTLIDTGLNNLKGSRIKQVEKYLDPEINMLTYGDGIADINIKELVAFHKKHGKIMTITGVHAPARFGEIVEKNSQVLSYMEKPQTSVGLINGGFMVFNNSFLDLLSIDEKCDFEKGPLEQIAEKGELMVYKHKGIWECMDHERDVDYLNYLWYSNKAFWKIW
ncbi:MAG: glucose-1-phosphate cytidylyltransferase [Candidatus Lokiarchaeota archaeon]|nr:glucose-1-phosphate cytidylyltransferase [Candidatus Lokiarchaeota archaeon]